MKREDLLTSLSALLRRFFKKQSQVKVTTYAYSRYQTPIRKIYKSKQEEIDALLDKISERGYDRLTKEEKQQLLDASHSI